MMFWLSLYLLQVSKLLCMMDLGLVCLVKIKKIVVETCETQKEPRLKLKSNNAIFHINFSAKSCDYKSVVKRTMDGKTGHIVLEINSWEENDQPSSA